MSTSPDSESQLAANVTFQSADEMVLSLTSPESEVRVAACSVAVEERTKLIVQVGIAVVIFIVIMGAGVDLESPVLSLIVLAIVLVEVVFIVYLGVMGGNDAIVLKEDGSGQNWGAVYVIKGVSYDKNAQVYSYKSLYELRRGHRKGKVALSPFGGFKFKEIDTTFTVISTLSKAKQNIYTNGMVSLKNIKGLLFLKVD